MNMLKLKILKRPWLAFFCALIIVGCDGKENKPGEPAPGADQKAPMSGTTVSEAGKEEVSRGTGQTSRPDSSDTTGEPASRDKEKSQRKPLDKPKKFVYRFEPPTQEWPNSEMDDEAEIQAQARLYEQAFDPDDRIEALEEIGSIDSDSIKAVDVFLGALNDPDPEVRLEAVSQLSDSDLPEAADGLVSALNDTDSEVVMEAIDGLSFLDNPSYITDLSVLLSHPDAEVQEAAQEAIEFLED
ncbi:MAG: HEAT repeat domain-containing protein [Pseudomonadota bacterium]